MSPLGFVVSAVLLSVASCQLLGAMMPSMKPPGGMMSSMKPHGGMMSSMMPGGGMMTTSMKPHGHHMKEPFELDQIMFNYDMQSNFLVAKTPTICYMMPLSMGEQKTVMSAAGLRMLEVQMFQMLGYAVHEAIKGSDLMHLGRNVGRMCANQTLVKIHM